MMMLLLALMIGLARLMRKHLTAKYRSDLQACDFIIDKNERLPAEPESIDAIPYHVTSSGAQT